MCYSLSWLKLWWMISRTTRASLTSSSCSRACSCLSSRWGRVSWRKALISKSVKSNSLLPQHLRTTSARLLRIVLSDFSLRSIEPLPSRESILSHFAELRHRNLSFSPTYSNPSSARILGPVYTRIRHWKLEIMSSSSSTADLSLAQSTTVLKSRLTQACPSPSGSRGLPPSGTRKKSSTRRIRIAERRRAWSTSRSWNHTSSAV